MKFGSLKVLFSLFKESGKKAEDIIDDNEILSRFLFQNGDFNKNTNKFKKHNRLLPLFNDKKMRYETSVYRTSLCKNDAEAWNIGDKFAGKPTALPKAMININARTLRSEDIKLDVVSSKEPHDLHADIINWPKEKEDQMLIAKILKRESTLVIRKP